MQLSKTIFLFSAVLTFQSVAVAQSSSRPICTNGAIRSLQVKTAKNVQRCERAKVLVRAQQNSITAITNRIAQTSGRTARRLQGQLRAAQVRLVNYQKRETSECSRATSGTAAFEARKAFCAKHFPADASGLSCPAGFARNESRGGVEFVCKGRVQDPCGGTIEERYYDNSVLYSRMKSKVARTATLKLLFAGKQVDGLYQVNFTQKTGSAPACQ